MEERSSAQEESTREAQGGIAGCVVLAQDEALAPADAAIELAAAHWHARLSSS
jgi:hypothetical protein